MYVPDMFVTQILPVGVAAAACLGWWRAAARGQALARSAEELAQEVLRLRENLLRVEEAASRDRLTGAWNRRHFDETVAAEMSLARRRRAPLCLIMLDLDHFKRINDTYGHAAGDGVLVGAVAAFRQVLRTSDALVRWGGEEFVVLSPATGLEGAFSLAERLRAALEVTPFPGAASITLSAGVADYLDGESLATWVGRADQALYRAKQEGRNRVITDLTRDSLSHYPTPGLLELVWEEAYGSGHRLIDEQHILLFDLSNALLAAVMEAQPLSMAEARLDTLLYHAEKHFHDEEALLLKAGYPDLDQHRGEHARLLAGARRLQGDLRAGQVDFGSLVAYLATDLVKGHLLSEDAHYFEHLHSSLARELPA